MHIGIFKLMSARGQAARTAPYALVGAGAGYLYYVAAQVQYQARPGTLGPDFWPKLILGLVIAACAYEIVKIVVAGRATQVEGVLGGMIEDVAPDAPGSPDAPPPRRPLLLLGGIGLTVGYVALVEYLGFFAATVVYLASFIVLAGYRRWWVVAAVSVLGTLLIVFFFMRVVYISLPLGQGAFQQLTLWLMQVLGIR
jgi:putative tricarboxylic transport membrane protein